MTVIRGGSTGSTVTVNVKTTGTGTAEGGAGPCGPGIDFTTATLPVTFNPGQTSKTVTIPLCTDTEVDGLETIGLALDNVVGRHARHSEHRDDPDRRERRGRHRSSSPPPRAA